MKGQEFRAETPYCNFFFMMGQELRTETRLTYFILIFDGQEFRTETTIL